MLVSLTGLQDGAAAGAAGARPCWLGGAATRDGTPTCASSSSWHSAMVRSVSWSVLGRSAAPSPCKAAPAAWLAASQAAPAALSLAAWAGCPAPAAAPGSCAAAARPDAAVLGPGGTKGVAAASRRSAIAGEVRTSAHSTSRVAGTAASCTRWGGGLELAALVPLAGSAAGTAQLGGQRAAGGRQQVAMQPGGYAGGGRGHLPGPASAAAAAPTRAPWGRLPPARRLQPSRKEHSVDHSNKCTGSQHLEAQDRNTHAVPAWHPP